MATEASLTPADATATRTQLVRAMARAREHLLRLGGAEALEQFERERRDGARAVEEEDEASAYVAEPPQLSDEQLAHELVLDPAFRFDAFGHHPFDSQVHC